MAHTLVCVKTGDNILDYAVFSRDAALVKFEGDWHCLSLRKDPCTGSAQYFMISGFQKVVDDLCMVDSDGFSQDRNECYCDEQIDYRLCHFCDEKLSQTVLFMLLNVNHRIVRKLPSNVACCCFKEIVRSRSFRKRFISYMKRNCKVYDVRQQSCNCEDVFKVVACGIELPLLIEVCLELEPPVINVCLAWCYRLEGLARKRLILEETMAWLSTLGGGFSSLGDYFLSFSEQAGKISVTQLQIAIEMGDPIMASKCRMFYALSLMQAGKLRQSKKMLRKEYDVAVQYKNRDSKLEDICKGMWSKLQYFYSRRKNNCISTRKPEHIEAYVSSCCLRQSEIMKERQLLVAS